MSYPVSMNNNSDVSNNALGAGPPRSFYLANLRTASGSPSAQLRVPSTSHSNGPLSNSNNSNHNGNHTLGGAKLPNHVPQRNQRYSSSDHTLGPSFDDDEEDEEMVAKMAALNAGGDHRPGSSGIDASGFGFANRQAQQQSFQNANQGGRLTAGFGNKQGGADGFNNRNIQTQPSRGNRTEPAAGQNTLQQQQQQSDLLWATLQMNSGGAQMNGSGAGTRNLAELQLLQALAQQQMQQQIHQREVEARMEQLLRLQHTQKLQQQLVAQAQKAALLSGQSITPQHQAPKMYQPQTSNAYPSSAQAHQQRVTAFDPYAQADRGLQRDQYQTPQQLASAYEQRQAAQLQIQANLRARSSAGGGGGGSAPPLPPPSSVNNGAGGAPFGFGFGLERESGPIGTGRPTSVSPRLSPSPLHANTGGPSINGSGGHHSGMLGGGANGVSSFAGFNSQQQQQQQHLQHLHMQQQQQQQQIHLQQQQQQRRDQQILSLMRDGLSPSPQPSVPDLIEQRLGLNENGGPVAGAGQVSLGPVVVIRQPRGPPHVPDELGSKNFASRVRKRAGQNLGVLGRREGAIEA
ncbi:hypothetical protein [Phaffia rhodozyma]|uniref:Uncharacterized protein n=1 Tax=Phaffia rhodozyma TaxID=264483 RepID=A0A0F7SL19_PHARH|nr:hypothetical protein [Phaffia rhodozyma]